MFVSLMCMEGPSCHPLVSRALRSPAAYRLSPCQPSGLMKGCVPRRTRWRTASGQRDQRHDHAGVGACGLVDVERVAARYGVSPRTIASSYPDNCHSALATLLVNASSELSPGPPHRRWHRGGRRQMSKNDQSWLTWELATSLP